MSNRKKYIKENNLNTNYCTVYILPMLGYKYDFLPKEEFISSYILEDNKIVLCFKNSSSEDFKGVIWRLQNNDDFISVDYDDNDEEVVLVFRVPKDKIIDFELFKIGRYTKFSNEYKEVLLNYHDRKSGIGKYITMVDSLFPDHLAKKYRADKIGCNIHDLPNGEVMSIPDMDRELYVSTSNLVKRMESEVGK